MLTEARRVTVTGADVAADMLARKQITRSQFQVLKRKPEAAKKIDMYTVLPDFVTGWTKYARVAEMYESIDQYVSDIEPDYIGRHYMR